MRPRAGSSAKRPGEVGKTGEEKEEELAEHGSILSCNEQGVFVLLPPFTDEVVLQRAA